MAEDNQPTAQQRPSVTQATRAVDSNTDIAVRIKACRGILRYAVRKCAQISTGATVENVEEIEFADAVERALEAYMKGRQSHAAGRSYVGQTAPIDDIAVKAAALLNDAA